MTPEQQQELVTAARAVANWLSKADHGDFCAARRMAVPGMSNDCDCGLWQTREALRQALARAAAGDEAEEGRGT